MRLFKRLRKKLAYLPKQQVQRIHAAYLLAMQAHRGQRRRTGEPYITHPVAVACVLADMHLDADTIMSALLHDVIEDTGVEKADLAVEFGQEVADIVDGVSKLTQIEFVSRAEAQAENFRKMVLAMAHDIRVILVKLADRLHNMRTLGSMPPEKRHRISKETLEIFAPIAKRLGMRDFSVELEELSFSSMYPRRYYVLKESVYKARGNRKKILAIINKTLQEGLQVADFPPCAVIGREKHLYSIYRKMRIKKVPFNDIMDVYAFRLIVDDVDTCYRALGLVHRLFKPVPERFKDYIAIPKANGYQSLHTTLFGPYGLPIEVQIRTTEMDRVASSGIAAHWLYKTDESDHEKSHLRAQKWVKGLLELQQSAGSSLEFIESVKVDLFPDEVYIFTPKGNIKELPARATGVDFAYAVHTDIGNSCVAVKVNRQLAPLSTKLSNGDTVEVVTSDRAHPNPAWMDFVVTSKARSAIRHFLKTQKRSAAITLGQRLLTQALREQSISLKKVSEQVWRLLLKETHLKSMDDIFADIGSGRRASALVAQRLELFYRDKSLADEIDAEQEEQSAGDIPLIVEGTEGMLLHFSACCHPIPGDPIVGVLKTGRGIDVHVETCRHVVKFLEHPEHCVLLRWAQDVIGEYPVQVAVVVKNEQGILAVLAMSLANADANIEDISVDEREGQFYLVNFKLLVKNRVHLASVIKGLRQIPQVVKMIRSK